MPDSVSLAVELAPRGKRNLPLPNPVMVASGTFGYGLEFTQFFDISRLGGFCTKGLSLEPLAGNEPGRIAETPAGMLNAIGLQNPGVASFCDHELPWLVKRKVPVIASIVGMVVTMALVLSGTWVYLWQLFGASNQLGGTQKWRLSTSALSKTDR